jgi:hypothetical protein
MKSTNVQTCGMIRFNMIWTFFHRHFFPTCQNPDIIGRVHLLKQGTGEEIV